MVLAADAAIGSIAVHCQSLCTVNRCALSIAVHCDVPGDDIGTSSRGLQGHEMTTLNLLDIKI